MAKLSSTDIYGKSSTSAVNISFGAVTSGNIYVKYRKDGSGHSGTDTFKFKVFFK